MSYYDKDYKILLELYRTVYASINVDFDNLDKVNNFFLDYEIDRETEDKLIEQVLNKHKLAVHQKNGIKISYYMGCSPKIKTGENGNI